MFFPVTAASAVLAGVDVTFSFSTTARIAYNIPVRVKFGNSNGVCSIAEDQ
jgi:hypothetical protein